MAAPDITPNDGWLTTELSAARGNTCTATVRRAISKGDLRAVQIGGQYRLRPSWVDDWLERQTHPRVRSADASRALAERNRQAATIRWDRYRAQKSCEAAR